MLRDYITEIKDKMKNISAVEDKRGYLVPFDNSGMDNKFLNEITDLYEGLIEVGFERNISSAAIAHEIVQRIYEGNEARKQLKESAEIIEEIKAHYK